MECNCNKCIEKKEEVERITALKKLNPKEIHILNKDKNKECNWYLIAGVELGILCGISVVFELFWLGLI